LANVRNTIFAIKRFNQTANADFIKASLFDEINANLIDDLRANDNMAALNDCFSFRGFILSLSLDKGVKPNGMTPSN